MCIYIYINFIRNFLSIRLPFPHIFPIPDYSADMAAMDFQEEEFTFGGIVLLKTRPPLLYARRDDTFDMERCWNCDHD